MKSLKLCCLLLVIACCLPDALQAHRVRVFAYGEGDKIVGETSFSGGRKPKNAEIIVTEAKGGRTLLNCRTDDQGRFSFKIPAEARDKHLDLLIVINGGEGHRGEWPLPAIEYLDEVDDNYPAAEQVKSSTDNGNGLQGKNTSQLPTVNEQQIRRVVAEVMEKKLAPIKYMLAENRDQGPGLRDILGGIGYILGLAGIAAYFKSKS